MSLNKRFTGDFNLESIDSGDRFSMDTAGGVTIDTTTDTPVLNVTAITAGIKYRIIFQGTTVFTSVGAVEYIAGAFEIGDEYVITAAGTTDFTLIGATDSDVGTMFTATDVGTGTGTAIDTLFTATGVGIGTGTAKAAQGVTITGDLTVLGRATSIKSTDTDIVDNTIILNSGEIGPGVTAPGVSGIEIDRGDGSQIGHYPAGIRFSEALGGVNDGGWEVNNGDNAWTPIVIGAGFSLVTDLDPHLGGDLNVNGWDIVSDAAVDINLLPGAGGAIALTTTTTGDITLIAADAVAVTAGTAVGITAGTTVDITATAGSLALTSINSSAAITAATTVDITGTQAVSLTSSTSNVILTATVANIILTAGTDISLTATGDATVSGDNVVLTATTTDLVISAVGVVKVEQELTLLDMGAAPAALAGYNKLYSATVGNGGTGLYFVNNTVTDELVSKKKAIAYSIIF